MGDEALMTVPEVAARLRVQEETIRRWLRNGRLKGVLLSRRGGYRIPASEVARFLSGEAPTPAPAKPEPDNEA